MPELTTEQIVRVHDSYIIEDGRLDKLYGLGKTRQWDADTDLNWSIDVDPTTDIFPDFAQTVYHIPEIWNGLSPSQIEELRRLTYTWFMSQFLHGEQGALLVANQLGLVVPDAASRFYVATQVMDEARHVEAFAKYIDRKLDGNVLAINQHLDQLLRQILDVSAFEYKLVGMQIVIEALALGAFSSMELLYRKLDPNNPPSEPLGFEMLQRIRSDEARHTGFGIGALRLIVPLMGEREKRRLQDFLCDAIELMMKRFIATDVWKMMGFDTKVIMKHIEMSESLRGFRKQLAKKIVPATREAGLLDAYVLKRFEQLGIAEFRDEGLEIEGLELIAA